MLVSEINIPKWNIEELIGYKPMTTFWEDFSIADGFGIPSIKDTYERVKSEWKNDYKYWTELCLVLNDKMWQWYETDKKKAALYDKLWRDAVTMVNEWPKEMREYHYRVTD